MNTQNNTNIGLQWFQERCRQANASFNVAVGFAGATALLSIVVAISVSMGKTSEATAAAALGLTSGAVSVYCFKLSDDANKRLDAAVKELLNEE
ncbi:hypothetical protein [Nostoc sp. 106C]|uniref:TRADD-N-associated membrane domain-containing protein n=1 Tax=Nostoc sp. 106C TaxID=1932667 RepID=UPI000A3B0B5F|nr:hypothetical protein [Nostoc sp. 106C]OUL31128.1 hypothetical protein BV375_12995 [Nostoc sp. 106C]